MKNVDKSLQDSKTASGATFTLAFLLMAILFTVCLIASNLFETKIFSAGQLTLTGGLLVFPISYILNDVLVEVYGYHKAKLVIWTAFAMNLFVVLAAQIVRVLPSPEFWTEGEHFNFIFGFAPRITLASMLAFVCGSTMNALVMSKMKIASNGRHFWLRAVVSSLAGESLDSLIFFPIAFGAAVGMQEMFKMMIIQVVLKTLYEVVILPVTQFVVKRVKAYENIDTYDMGISYNPFSFRNVGK